MKTVLCASLLAVAASTQVRVPFFSARALSIDVRRAPPTLHLFPQPQSEKKKNTDPRLIKNKSNNWSLTRSVFFCFLLLFRPRTTNRTIFICHSSFFASLSPCCPHKHVHVLVRKPWPKHNGALDQIMFHNTMAIGNFPMVNGISAMTNVLNARHAGTTCTC